MNPALIQFQAMMQQMQHAQRQDCIPPWLHIDSSKSPTPSPAGLKLSPVQLALELPAQPVSTHCTGASDQPADPPADEPVDMAVRTPTRRASPADIASFTKALQQAGPGAKAALQEDREKKRFRCSGKRNASDQEDGSGFTSGGYHAVFPFPRSVFGFQERTDDCRFSFLEFLLHATVASRTQRIVVVTRFPVPRSRNHECRNRARAEPIPIPSRAEQIPIPVSIPTQSRADPEPEPIRPRGFLQSWYLHSWFLLRGRAEE